MIAIAFDILDSVTFSGKVFIKNIANKNCICYNAKEPHIHNWSVNMA